jgi:hypothetical protein
MYVLACVCVCTGGGHVRNDCQSDGRASSLRHDDTACARARARAPVYTKLAPLCERLRDAFLAALLLLYGAPAGSTA